MVMPESFAADGSTFGNASSDAGQTSLYAAPNYFGDFNISQPPWVSMGSSEMTPAYIVAGFAIVGLAVYLWKQKK